MKIMNRKNIILELMKVEITSRDINLLTLLLEFINEKATKNPSIRVT